MVETVFILLLFLPVGILIAATKFLDEGLKDVQLIYWKKIYIAFGLLLFTCIYLIVEIAMGLLLGVVFVFIFTSVTALISGLYLSYFLPQWRKLFGLLVGIGFPVIMFISSSTIGIYFDPDSIIRRNGEAIAQALNKYHTDKGKYPKTLEELIPTYLTELKEPQKMWGWLYIADKDSFTLGYVNYIDSMGYIICKYSRTVPEWDCPTNYSTEPFLLQPTPMP